MFETFPNHQIWEYDLFKQNHVAFVDIVMSRPAVRKGTRNGLISEPPRGRFCPVQAAGFGQRAQSKHPIDHWYGWKNDLKFEIAEIEGYYI